MNDNAIKAIAPPPDAAATYRPWGEAIIAVAAHYRLDCSEQALSEAATWASRDGATSGMDETLALLARQAGLAWRWAQADATALTPWRLPVVVQLTGGQVGVVTTRTDTGFTVQWSGDAGLPSAMDAGELSRELGRVAVLRPLESAPDARVDDYVKPVEPGWLRHLVFTDVRPYWHVILASFVTNLMAMAGILFSMQVYDRVIPAQSYPTLYVLFGGVMIATALGFVMRHARMRITDALGKRADLRISDRVFGHALRVRNSARPRATGTFISQLRDLEQVREMLTSSTVGAVADLPFFVFFCLVFWVIGGPLVWIPLGALVLIVLPGLLLQPRLRMLAQASMRESALRNAMLVEAVQGIEDIKQLQAEPHFQNLWNRYNRVNADSGLRLRDLVGSLANWMQTVQATVFVVVVLFGAPMVMNGDITTGVLVAASILSTRMLAPLSGLVQVVFRWQQAKVAKAGLDNLMALPVDAPAYAQRIHLSLVQGDYDIKQAAFSYDGKTPALQVAALRIRAGERIAVLGRNGAGKSSLLQVLSGMMEPVAGTVLLSGVNLGQIDPADVRRDVGLVSQNARLFYGTLRENLCLGAPMASDAEIIEALKASGGWTFVQHMAQGLDYPVQEGGLGLSGGQRQSLLLARMLLRRPRVLLLDEPTASLDDDTERAVIHTLSEVEAGTTLVIATHRRAVLALVTRIIVVDGGRVVLDGPRDDILAKLTAKPAPANGSQA